MFVYSLPLFFADIKLASPVELLLIAAALGLVLYLISPPVATQPLAETDSYLFAAWSGAALLGWAFWPFFIVLNTGLFTADTLAKMGLLTVSSWDDVHLMLALPTVWWTVAVWRCSPNTRLHLWAAAARLCILAVFFEYGLKLVLRIDYPRIFFGCEELLLDYGSCF